MQQSITIVKPYYKTRDAKELVGSLSAPSKMPCHGYSIPATMCKVGSKLHNVPDSVCANCYALKGRYMFPNVQEALQKRAVSLDDPRWVSAMVSQIRSTKNAYFRWHDSGDIQSFGHLLNIVSIAEALPSVQFWLPTREYRLVTKYQEVFGDFPSNLTVRVSAHMVDVAPPRGFANTSTVHKANEPQGYRCPAPKQGNECKDCRACWDRDVYNVSYHAH
jgi:hypothetical protein